ncbi:FitA-like ribbon-helix-helix domain-containing protein [Paracraurococcus lichenis]|uniref:Antitoxin FitA-like ribbon-helix-helix domain-containing protein n=1 Tax=Paracraurococcus lichenis TaxID=3064888 RepID=A0ABT9DZ35_9PROT|nr:hypothetical protein [Paracraurococcus sp. LOR1-02]MDO9709168.1 hypothetical protein [Paracraurococcus sp. LOR1-02]
MNAISLPELEPDLQDWLSRRASAHGVSLAEEVRAILRAQKSHEVPPTPPLDDAARKAKWEALFAMAIKMPPGAPSTLELLREDRDSH